ncbi:MAG: diguanylate cyclase [Desulfobulbaceae bacterium]|nr:diguanylate cyclase [Desulfobulbaceae bacterium]
MGKTVVNEETETEMKPAEKATVLIVDNQPVVLKMLNNFLTKKGYEVFPAEDGLQALELLETITPSVIFTDLVMPNIGGDKLCKIVRRMKKLKDTYIAVISGIAAEDEVDFLAWGANACIAKGPFKELSQNVLTVLERAERCGVSNCCPEVLGLENIYQREMTKELLFSNRHFEVTIDNMSEGIVEFVRDSKIVYANPAALAVLDVYEDKLLASRFVDLFVGADRKRIETIVDEIREDAVFIDDDDPVVINGKTVILAFLPVIHGDYSSVIVIVRDITARKSAEVKLAFESRLNETAAKIAEMLLSADSMADTASYILEQAKLLTESPHGFIGYIDSESGELVPSAMSRDMMADQDEPPSGFSFCNFRGLWGWVLTHKKSFYTNEAETDSRAVGVPEGHIPIKRFLGAPSLLKRKLSGLLVLANGAREYTDQDLKVIERLASLYGLALQKQRDEARIEFLAHHDPLTGLVNRHLFADRMKSAMAMAERHRHKLALLFIDLNDFKMINDTLGHEAGDHVLEEVARRLLASVRGSDTVARLGGDEFIVVLHDIHNQKAAAVAAEKILNTFRQPILVNGKVCSIGAAIGISIFPDDGEDQETLIRKADKVMYQVKAKGESGFDFFK